MLMRHPMNRRKFLKVGTQTLASSTLLATLGGMERVLAAGSDTSGYKALVCIFLTGGNDSFNWIVPSDNAGYQVYQTSRRSLALPQNSLLPIAPAGIGAGQYGLHASSSGVKTLFDSGKAAFVANVGTLVEPITRTQYLNRSVALPRFLFSHSDQQEQWMTSVPQSSVPSGWGGRIADLLSSQAGNPRLSFNISLSGSNVWQGGLNTQPYALGTGGAPEFSVINDPSEPGDPYLELLNQARTHPSLLTREYAGVGNRSVDLAEFVNDSLASVPELNTVFPNDRLGQQLKMTARMIRARGAVGQSRQMFFISYPDFDTHDEQAGRLSSQLESLSAGLLAFQNAMAEINAENDVTTFTASDFGRTLTSNGDGSDHGWGGHALVVGGAVAGGRIYGTMPNLTINGPDDAELGRIIPTLSTDQYGATLARWFGVSESDLGLVFPNLDHFGSSNLGFMG